MHIKTTERFHLTPIRVVSIKNTHNNKCWWGYGGEKGALIHWYCEHKLVQPFGKQYGGFLKNRSAIWSSNATPRDIPNGMQLKLLQRHLHTHFYCSTIHNSQAMESAKMLHSWRMIKKMCYLHTM
jgi:hypothetical protein